MQWTGLLVVLIALAAATAYGLLRQSRQGRIKQVLATYPDAGGVRLTDQVDAGQPAAAEVDGLRVAPAQVAPAAEASAGEASLLAGIGVVAGQVTLLQFSSAFCAPCRATRSVLADVAGRVDGVTHLEVDAESQLEVVRALKIWRTPTTFIIDTEGRIVGRAQGIPHRGQVLAAVTPLLTNHPTALQGQPS